MSIAIIVHGGAWEIPAALHADHVAGITAAVASGWQRLADGRPAIDAVEAAIRVMEDHPVFDAGTGAVLNQDGDVELDAAVMDGSSLDAGAVAGLRRIKNPISLARKVLTDSPHLFLVGQGAERFAAEQGIPFCDPESLVVERERAVWRKRLAAAGATGGPADTVGALAVDADGNVAAGNSTGGTTFKYPGRVGDTALLGCGLYADNEVGAAACTGHGEQIMRALLAKVTLDRLAGTGDPQAAVTEALAYFKRRVGGSAGIICLGSDGRIGWGHTSVHMACAYRTSDMTDTFARIGSLK
jgi:L-asparaginase / beta-aspartyl-peptidase